MRYSKPLVGLSSILALSCYAPAYKHNLPYEQLQTVVSQLKLDAQQQNAANEAIGQLKTNDSAIRRHEQDTEGSHANQRRAALRKAISKIDGVLTSVQKTQFHNLLEKAGLNRGKEEGASTQPDGQ